MRMYNHFEKEIKHFSPDAFIKLKSNMEKQGLPSFNNQMLEYTYSLIFYKLITKGSFFMEDCCKFIFVVAQYKNETDINKWSHLLYKPAMFKISVWVLVAFSTKTYCADRDFLYTKMWNKETNVSLAVIYNNARSVIHCSVKCLNDYCCEAYIYQNKNTHY